MTQNFNQPPPDNAPIPLFLGNPVPKKKKTYEIGELINFIIEAKQGCEDMAALGSEYKDYAEAARIHRDYADKYQAIIEVLKENEQLRARNEKLEAVAKAAIQLDDDLNHHNIHIVGWHQNGDWADAPHFFEDLEQALAKLENDDEQ